MYYRDIHPWFKATFKHYDCPAEMQDAFWNYFAYGWNPGGFGMCILQNDFIGAVCRAHPLLTADHLRNIAKWLINHAPDEGYGSSRHTAEWMNKTDEERRAIMIEYRLRPDVIDILKGEPA